MLLTFPGCLEPLEPQAQAVAVVAVLGSCEAISVCNKLVVLSSIICCPPSTEILYGNVDNMNALDTLNILDPLDTLDTLKILVSLHILDALDASDTMDTSDIVSIPGFLGKQSAHCSTHIAERTAYIPYLATGVFLGLGLTSWHRFVCAIHIGISGDPPPISKLRGAPGAALG